MNTQKKVIWAVFLLAMLAVAAYGISRATDKVPENENGSEVAANPCSVDISAIIMEDPEQTLSTREEIAQAVFNNYFNAYTKIPECPQAGINGYRLISYSNITEVGEDHFTIDIVFDLEPISIEETEWTTPEATIEDGWIKNKEGVLSIRKYEGRYYLVI